MAHTCAQCGQWIGHLRSCPFWGVNGVYDVPPVANVVAERNGTLTTAQGASLLLHQAATTMEERDAIYKGSDKLYAELMAVLFPEGVTLTTEHDQHRFHIFMLAMVKVTRYARSWNTGGHADSLTDLINYAAMLQHIDANSPSEVR